jgi:hypothetical protein
MNWQPVIDQAALWMSWEPWKWLVFVLIIWHGMIGAKTARKWMEALGWQGVLGFLNRVGWVKEPPVTEHVPVEQPKFATVIRP